MYNIFHDDSYDLISVIYSQRPSDMILKRAYCNSCVIMQYVDVIKTMISGGYTLHGGNLKTMIFLI
jgi:hypothetical protein